MTMHRFCGLDNGRGRAIILQTDRQTDRQTGRQTDSVKSVRFCRAKFHHAPTGRTASVDFPRMWCALFVCAGEEAA